MKLKTLLLSTIFTMFSGSLMAGKVMDVNVTIDLEARVAAGNMKTARFSDNEEEYIGCGTRTAEQPDGTTYSWGWCQAALDTVENYAFCSTENPDLLNQINSSSAYSYLIFRWDEDGICRYVGHSTQSFYIPSKKDK